MEPIEVVSPDIDAGAFHEKQKAAGATFYEDYGRLWTRSFGDPVAEYWATRRGVALWDVYALIKWRFSGPDALVALDHLTTRRVSGPAAEPGAIRYGMMLDEAGLILDEGTNFVVSATETYWMGNDDREPFAEHVRRHTADLDVEVENATARIPNVAVQGPRAFELLSGLVNDSDRLAALKYFRLIPELVEVAGVPCLISRTGFTGELGYELFLTEGDAGAGELWDAIETAGAHPIGLDAIEMLRIELGLVIQEEDYFPGQTDPLDLSLEGFVDFDGHEFIGQQALAARATKPARRFKTLALQGSGVAEHGEQVTLDGKVVGSITSASESPRFGVLALAVLDAAGAHDGKTVDVAGRSATVSPLPFDSQGRARTDPRNPDRIKE